jgi:hypothetical protein
MTEPATRRSRLPFALLLLRRVIACGVYAPPQIGSRLAFVTSLPTWTVWALSFGSPALTAVIACVAQYLSRRAARELEARSKREEVMRTLRWAAELAASNDAAKARLGVRQLKALQESKMLTPIEQEFVYAALEVTIKVPRQVIAQSTEEVEAVIDPSTNVAEETLVSSEEEWGEETDI